MKLTRQFFLDEFYLFPRQLSDETWIAILQDIYTFSICMNLDAEGYEKKYVFDVTSVCISEYYKLNKCSDVPHGYIKSYIL